MRRKTLKEGLTARCGHLVPARPRLLQGYGDLRHITFCSVQPDHGIQHLLHTIQGVW